MANPSKRKGSAWEVAIRDYLLDRQFRVVRNPASGSADIGDLALEIAGRHYCIEAKATRGFDLSQFVGEAAVQADHYARLNRLDHDLVHPVVVIKRRSHATGRAYVVQEFEEWLRDHPR